jgi:hypothetical protein
MAAFADMFFVEFIRKNLDFLSTVGAPANKRF